MSRRTVFRMRYATILAKIGSKPRVMENGIKSPSLHRGPRVCATVPEPTTALNAQQ